MVTLIVLLPMFDIKLLNYITTIIVQLYLKKYEYSKQNFKMLKNDIYRKKIICVNNIKL